MSKYSLVVANGESEAPFLRGILTHSLTKRGLGFKEAYNIANLTREKLQGERRVSRDQLRATVEQILRKEYGKKLPDPPVVVPSVVLVTGEETVPFSKGILSRSLSPAGLDPSVTYKVALQIQTQLIDQKIKSISRKKLRKLVYNELLETHGKETARRYLVGSYIRSPEKPVILFLGGSSGVGKTSVGTEVAHRLGIDRIVNTDSIREIMRMMFSRDLLPSIHYSSYDAWKASWPGRTSSETVTDAFVEQSQRVVVGVTALVDRAIKEKHNLVIEGVHLIPGLLDESRFESKAHCVHAVVANLDAHDLAQRFPRRTEKEGERSAQKYLDHLDAILHIQEYILEMALQHDISIVENEDFEEAVAQIVTTMIDCLLVQLDLEGEKLVARAL